jgi:ATP-dependent Clp endopeptidase proteolytic subunit ClpP
MNTKNLLEHSIDFDQRRIYLMENITYDLTTHITKAIHAMEQSDGVIELWINSAGGELVSSFGLYDVIQRLDPKRTPIHTIVSGEAASAAFLLLASGHKRFSSESSWGMAHSASGGGGGTTDEVASSAAAMQAMEQWMWYLLSRHTKKTATQWLSQARHSGEVWLSAQQMVSYGVIDEILKPHADRKFRASSFIGGVKKKTPVRKKKAPRRGFEPVTTIEEKKDPK